MQRFNFCCAIYVLIIHISDITLACGRSSITLQNNGYSNILVAISDEVPDNPSLLQRIREVFTEASAALYTATRFVKVLQFKALSLKITS